MLRTTIKTATTPKTPKRVQYVTQKLRLQYAERLLAEALDRMLRSDPPLYGRTWTTCLRIKRFLK